MLILKDVYVTVFNIVARINKAKTLVKHVSGDCKWKFNVTTCNSNKKWNDDNCPCECNEVLYVQKIL